MEQDDVNELLAMSDAIRDDGLYNVEVVDWEKSHTGSSPNVHITYRTPFGTTESETFNWPTKPTTDSTFIKILMVALDLDDPSKAVARAPALKEHGDGKPSEHTVPADVLGRDAWTLKPNQAEQFTTEANGSGLTKSRIAFITVVWPVAAFFNAVDYLFQSDTDLYVFGDMSSSEIVSFLTLYTIGALCWISAAWATVLLFMV